MDILYIVLLVFVANYLKVHNFTCSVEELYYKTF